MSPETLTLEQRIAMVAAGAERLKQRKQRWQQEESQSMATTEAVETKPNGIKEHCSHPDGCTNPLPTKTKASNPKYAHLCLVHKKKAYDANRWGSGAKKKARAKPKPARKQRFAAAKAKVARSKPRVMEPAKVQVRGLAHDLATIYRRLDNDSEKLVIGKLLADAVLE